MGEKMTKGEQELAKRLDRIEAALRPLPDRYMTQQDIAAKLQVSETTVRRLLAQDGAPKPLPAQTNENGQVMKPRYSPKRVNEWLEWLDELGQSSNNASSAASGS